MQTFSIANRLAPSSPSLRPMSPWQRDLIFTGLIGLWLALLGPFNNFSAGPLATRVTFHVLLALTNFAVFRFAVTVALRASYGLGLSPWALGFAALAASCLPLSFFAACLGIWLFPHLQYILSPADWIVETTVLDLPIACTYAGVLYLLRRRGDIKSGGSATTDRSTLNVAPAPVYIGGIPCRDVLAVEVEEHYVRLFTITKTHLVLMSFKEAVSALRGSDGVVVHRSWWVAKRAVTGIKLTARGGHLVLWNGARVPVSRSAISRVREAHFSGSASRL